MYGTSYRSIPTSYRSQLNVPKSFLEVARSFLHIPRSFLHVPRYSITNGRSLTIWPPPTQRASSPSSRGFFIQQSSSRGLLIGNHEAEIFKELYKIEELISRKRATGKFKELIKLRKRLEYRRRFRADFSTVLDPHFGPPFSRNAICLKRRPCLAKLRFGPGF
jgi:hypothetical protein